ncbi:hypothetical protein [Azotobacter armeniacus]
MSSDLVAALRILQCKIFLIDRAFFMMEGAPEGVMVTCASCFSAQCSMLMPVFQAKSFRSAKFFAMQKMLAKTFLRRNNKFAR